MALPRESSGRAAFGTFALRPLIFARCPALCSLLSSIHSPILEEPAKGPKSDRDDRIDAFELVHHNGLQRPCPPTMALSYAKAIAKVHSSSWRNVGWGGPDHGARLRSKYLNVVWLVKPQAALGPIPRCIASTNRLHIRDHSSEAGMC